MHSPRTTYVCLCICRERNSAHHHCLARKEDCRKLERTWWDKSKPEWGRNIRHIWQLWVLWPTFRPVRTRSVSVCSWRASQYTTDHLLGQSECPPTRTVFSHSGVQSPAPTANNRPLSQKQQTRYFCVCLSRMLGCSIYINIAKTVFKQGTP